MDGKPSLSDIRRAVSARHPGVRVTVKWSARMRRVTYPTGVRGHIGRVVLSAAGFRSREYIVSADSHGFRLA